MAGDEKVADPAPGDRPALRSAQGQYPPDAPGRPPDEVDRPDGQRRGRGALGGLCLFVRSLAALPVRKEERTEKKGPGLRKTAGLPFCEDQVLSYLNIWEAALAMAHMTVFESSREHLRRPKSWWPGRTGREYSRNLVISIKDADNE